MNHFTGISKAVKDLRAKANDTQHGGDHYRNKPIQPWDFIAANGLDFFQGNIIKYVVRFREKHGVSDLEKAKHYLEKLIELEHTKGVRE